MAISPDVLATALNELMPAYSELFVKWHPLLDNILKGGNMDRAALKGPKREFAVVTDGPGTVTHVQTGTEVIAGGRTQNAHRGNVVAPRLIYAFDVPGKDLAEANGEMDLARILQHYPELALADFHERIAKQLGTGNGSGVGSFVTMNGNTTFNPDGTARDGLFEFAALGSQTNEVHGLVSQGGAGGITGWGNQYEDVSSFATNGRTRLRKAYFAASRQGKTLGPVDLMIGDEQSYLNYIEDLDDQVRVVYGFKTPTWYLFTLGHDASRETKGDFAVRGPFRIPDQDLYRYEIVLMMGMHTTQRRANFAVTGCATP